jgi:hypothetical protein
VSLQAVASRPDLLKQSDRMAWMLDSPVFDRR